MKFLDQLPLAKKLSVYLAAFVTVSVLFLAVFFFSQYSAYQADAQDQMKTESAAVTAQIHSDMKVQQTLMEQVASDAELRSFVRQWHDLPNSGYQKTAGRVLRRLLDIRKTLDGSRLLVANNNATIQSEEIFRMTIEEFLAHPWVDSRIEDPSQTQSVYWACGPLQKGQNDWLICYQGLYSATSPYGLEMVAVLAVPASRIEQMLDRQSENTEFLLVGLPGQGVLGNEALGLTEEEIRLCVEASAGEAVRLRAGTYTVVSTPFSDEEMNLTGGVFLALQNPEHVRESFRGMAILWAVVLLTLLGTLAVLTRSVTKHIIFRNKTVMKHIARIAAEDFTVSSELEGNDEFYLINEELNGLSVRLKRLITDDYKNTMALQQAAIEKQQLQLEYQQEQIVALQNQINPHYIVNTLEAIRMKLLIQGERESSEMVLYLTESLRTYAWTPHSVVTLREELAFLDRYLILQNYRFLNKITYHVEVDDRLLDVELPHFLLQPLVENAIQHGFKNMVAEPHLELSILAEGEDLYLVLSDNGLGMEEEALQTLRRRMEEDDFSTPIGGASIGVLNVCRRVKLLYGRDCGLTIKSKPGYGTEIEIRLKRTRKEGL